MEDEIEMRQLAIEYTIQYFADKPQVAQQVFIEHLEKIYNFLKTGTITF
jgi:hypothetical protein